METTKETNKKDHHKAVFGIYPDRGAVERGVDRLKMEGFRNSDISVLMPEKGGADTMAHEKATKAPEGATTGAGAGLAIGGTLGWLVGIGALAIPGVGPFIAAGPIIALLAGAGTGAAVGALAGGLVGMGIPEYEAKRYEGFIRDGGILLSVHTDDADWLKKAERALEETGAEEISSTGESSVPRSDKTVRRDETPRRTF